MTDRTPTISSKALSACCGSILTSLLVTPFDVVKTRMQTSASPLSLSNNIKLIARSESLSAFWKGLSPTLLMSLPATTIYYIGYEHLRDGLGATGFAPVIAGSTSRLIAAVVISPLELVRIRLQATQTTTLADTLVDLRRMVRANGLVYLWRGLGPTLWRDVPFSAVYWFGYEFMKKRLMSDDVLNAYPHAVPFCAGALSGIVAATVTTPFDVAKTLQQVDHGKRPQPMLQILIRIFKTEGTRGLFRGLSPRIAKVSPSCAIMISTYEFGKAFLD